MEISNFVIMIFIVNIRTSGWRRRAGVGVASTGTRGPHRLPISRAMARKQAPQTLKTFENHDLEQNFVENRSLDGITTLMATLAALSTKIRSKSFVLLEIGKDLRDALDPPPF